MIPSLIWKFVGGWANHLCKVINQEIIERVMDYHGSKSITGLNVPQVANKLVIVKEQRVDGSCIESNTFLSVCSI